MRHALPLSYCPKRRTACIPGTHHGSAACAGQVRLPPRTCAAVNVCTMRRALASRFTINDGRDANSIRECTRPPPAPKHPGAALMRLTAFPSSKPAMFRMLRDARCNRVVEVGIPFANAGNKTPPGLNPRAFALPRGDRGDRSPAGKISRVGPFRRAATARARIRCGRRAAVRCALRCGRRFSWRVTEDRM